MAQRTPRRSYDEYPDRDYDRSYDGYDDGRRPPVRTGTGAASGQRRASSGQRRSSSGRPSAYSEPRRSGSGGYSSRRPPVRGTNRKRKRKKGVKGLVALLIVLAVLAAGVIFVLSSGILKQPEAEVVVEEDNRPLPAAPAVVSNATIGSTGDIILHVPILDAHAVGDDYDFSYCFANVAPVYQKPDLMFANLEVTLGGPESGEYTGYPGFNSPDAIVPALKNAGVDVCLTANNHANDTGYYGMMRTLEVLDEYGMEHLGSREDTEEKYLMIKNINGIRLGMLCYTYDTREYTEGEKSLNFNYLSDEGVQKISTFNYDYLDEFYADVQKQLEYMDMLNIDASVVFMHWGAEYEDVPNALQTEIAQHLCEMGVDVIIGGHPHVIQKFDTLTSSDGHETICLYSMGNELSNQRADIMDEDGNRGYTEDGLVMQVSFEKFNNGKVRISGVDIIPTWVELDGTGYQIIGLEGEDPWSWGAGDTYAAINSYNRTLERLSEAYPAYRAEKGQSQVAGSIE